MFTLKKMLLAASVAIVLPSGTISGAQSEPLIS